MNTTDATLIGLLAATDAIFRPLRRADWNPPTPAVLFEHRQRFATDGVPWTVGGSGAARLGGERDLQELQAGGLLVLTGKAKRSGVRLTDLGEAAVRSLCGLPSIIGAHEMIRQIVCRGGRADDGLTICPETWLWGADDYADSETDARMAWEVSLLLAPALSRGWVKARSDVRGRAYYSVPLVGLEVAAAPAPSLPDDLPEWQEPCGRLYHDLTLAARERLRSAKATNPGEIGECPLPASIDLQRPRRRKAKK